MNAPSYPTTIRFRDALSQPWLTRARQAVLGPNAQSALDTWLMVIGFAALALGLAGRLWDLPFPARTAFDEEHFVINARNYLAGYNDANDHPPLGKLLIAVGTLMLDDHSLGWRIVPLAFGLQTIVLAFLLARRIFDDPRAGLLAAMFISIDGFFVCYSRTALLDGMLTCLMIWSALSVVVARSGKDVVVAAFLIGIASSVKWTGVLMVIPATLWLLFVNRSPRRWLLWLALVPVVHIAVWSFALWVSGQANGLSDVIAIIRRLLTHHLSRGSVTHPALSRWYTWPIMYHPITINTQHIALRVRTLSSIGNPFLWWSASLAVLATASAALLSAVPAARRWFDERIWKGGKEEERLSLTGTVFAILCWASPFLPWILTSRDSYIYHYLPSYGFGLVLLAGVVAWLFRRGRAVAWAFLLIACAVSIYYIPVSSQYPLTQEQLNHRLVFDTWR